MSAESKIVDINTRKSREETVTSRKPSVLLTRLPSEIHRSREMVAKMMKKAMQAIFDSVDDALFDLADKASSNQDQNTFFEAMREVRLQRRLVESEFFKALDSAYGFMVGQASREASEEPNGLSLVENDQLELQVAQESMEQKALRANSRSVKIVARRFDALVDAAVVEKNCPLSPKVICESFAEQVAELDIDVRAKLVLLKLFDKAVMSQLEKVYTNVNTLLAKEGVLPNLEAATAPKRSQAGGNTQGGTQQQMSEQTLPQDEQSEALFQQLRELIRGPQAGQFAQHTSPSMGGAPMTGVPSAEMGASSTGVSNHYQLTPDDLQKVLSHAQRQRATVESHSLQPLAVNQVMGMASSVIPSAPGPLQLDGADSELMGVVSMLFEFILGDKNLADTMRAQLGRLQIPILRVAVRDRSFLMKSTHPARRLLNELASSALGWQAPEEGEPNDPLYNKICGLVETILEEFDSDVSVFNGWLQDFVAFKDKEARRSSVIERRTIDAEDGKAKAESARELVAKTVQSVIGEAVLPKTVNELIHGPWSNVLFLDALNHGEESEEWGQNVDVVRDLVWSVRRIEEPQDQKQLMRLLPVLVKQIRRGLETINFSPVEANQLFKSLQLIHMSFLKGSPLPQGELKEESLKSEQDESVAPADESSQTQLSEKAGSEESTESTVGAEASSEAHLEEQSAVASDPVAPSPATSEKLTPNDSEISAQSNVDAKTHNDTLVSKPQAPSEAWLAQVDRLSTGNWFEVSEEESAAFRCRLAAVIKSVGRYIFVNRNGMKVAEKSREELALALELNHYSMLDNGQLFDRALESIIEGLKGRASDEL